MFRKLPEKHLTEQTQTENKNQVLKIKSHCGFEKSNVKLVNHFWQQ